MAKSPVRLARRYARALFESYEVATLEQVRDGLSAVALSWSSSASLRDAVANPAVPMVQRVGVMAELAQRLRPNDTKFFNFVSLVVSNGRADSLVEIAKAFSLLVDAVRKILAVEIRSAHQVPSSEQASLQNQLQSELGTMASVSWSVDPNLLGGLTVKAGDKLLDGSVRGALQRMRAELRS